MQLPWKPWGWSLNFWPSSETLTLTLHQASHNCMSIFSNKKCFWYIWNKQAIVQFPQTTNYIHCINFLWIFVSFCKNLLVLIYPKLKEKTHCHQIFLSINISTVNLSQLGTLWQCGTENVIKISSEHRSGQEILSVKIFTQELFLGVYMTEIGETHLNNLLCTLILFPLWIFDGCRRSCYKNKMMV